MTGCGWEQVCERTGGSLLLDQEVGLNPLQLHLPLHPGTAHVVVAEGCELSVLVLLILHKQKT